MKLLLMTLFFFSIQDDIEIKVVDKNTKEELIGAKVSFNDTTLYTDFDGKLLIKTDKDKIEEIKVEYPSYYVVTEEDLDNLSTIEIELESK